MKKFRKLIPALCMLLVSALFVGTSTYAWFSMNTTVTATNMQVKAKSNATYLLINTDGAAKSGNTEVNINADATVYPAKFFAAGGALGENPNQITVPQNGWYTANNKNSDNATNAVMNYKLVNSADANEFKDYVNTSTMYLTLSQDSEDWTKYVKVSVSKGEDNDASASIVLKVTQGDSVTYIEGAAGYIDCTTANLTSSNTIKVEALTYIDGTSANVYSDFQTIADLKGTFNLTFDLTDTNV